MCIYFYINFYIQMSTEVFCGIHLSTISKEVPIACVPRFHICNYCHTSHGPMWSNVIYLDVMENTIGHTYIHTDTHVYLSTIFG